MSRRATLLLLGFLVPALLPPDLGAAWRVWTGNASRYWSHSGNWLNGAIPQTGDVIEFPENARNRLNQNDLAQDLELQAIILSGKNYELLGSRLNLRDGIRSLPSNSTNRLSMDLNFVQPQSIIHYGYVNLLEFSGTLFVRTGPLTMEARAPVEVRGTIYATNAPVIQQGSGSLTFGLNGGLVGNLTVERGILTLPAVAGGGTLRGPLGSHLTIGNDLDPAGYAQVRLMMSERIGDRTRVSVHRSGILEFVGIAGGDLMTETIGCLDGAGLVRLGAGHLKFTAHSPDGFSGDITGTGSIQLGTEAMEFTPAYSGSLQVDGDVSLNGPINVLLGSLRMSGSLSNAVVSVQANNEFDGTGVLGSLSSYGGHVRLRPGTLRILNHGSLDWWTKLWIQIDGPDAANLAAGTLDLGNCYLGASYDGDETQSAFTLVSAGTSLSTIFRDDIRPLPEGAGLVAGDPGNRTEFRISYAANQGRDVVVTRTKAQAPTLQIRLLPDRRRVLEWPITAEGYTLQHSLDLTPGGWSADGLPLADATASWFFVIEDLPGPHRFFRLIR